MIPDKQVIFFFATVNPSCFCHPCAAVSASQVSQANAVRKTSMSAHPTPARTKASAKTLWTGKYHGNTELHFFHYRNPRKLIMM